MATPTARAPAYVAPILPIGLRRVANDAAVLTTCLATLALFGISSLTLEHFGVPYGESGGGVFTKFHPATFLFVLAFAARCLAAERPVTTAWRLLTDDAGVALLLLSTSIAFAYAALISKTPVTGLVDTFILPSLCFVMLRDLDAAVRSWLAAAVLAILAINAVMALAEFAQHRHFISIDLPPNATADPTRPDAGFDWRAEIALDWRATALFGHPLENGLIVGCGIICLAAPAASWIAAWIRLPLLALLVLSMFAFGARASLVLAFAFAALVVMHEGVRAVASGRRLDPRHAALACLVVIGLIAAGVAAFGSGFFDRTLQRFVTDEGSAQARVKMLELFRPLSWGDILLGPNPDVVATQRRLQGLEFGIESPWVGFTLVYGLIVTCFLGAGLLTFLRSITRHAGRGALAVVVMFFLVVSTSASLSGKTKDVAVLAAMVMLLLPRLEAPWDGRPIIRLA